MDMGADATGGGGMSRHEVTLGDVVDAIESISPTLRDQFAMAAIQGAAFEYAHDANMRADMPQRCANAYAWADAMLKARMETDN